MSKLPALTGEALISLLTKIGFVRQRQRGSHVFIKHPDGRAAVVPIHSGETIGPGLLSKILRDVDLTRDELSKLIEE
jgi:predicted RNA binding protein YcfA (HicA-like mRNA interferase family)